MSTPPASSVSPGANPADPAALLQQVYQQQQMHQQQLQQLHQKQQAGLGQPAPLDLNALAQVLISQQAAMQQQQLQATAQLLSIQALGPVPPFAGSGAVTSLEAASWLQRVERHNAARDAALGIPQADATKILLACSAFPDKSPAQVWYSALPLNAIPTTWVRFSEMIRERFGNVVNARVRVDQLRAFVDAGRRLRDKMNSEGLQNFTARFQQLSGEIPDSHLTAHGKLELLARGLPQRLSEVVLTEDAREPPAPLHEIIQRVLAKASFREYAAGFSGASPASAAVAMEIDAISLCATQFGISRDEARRYLEPQEGWEQHDTHRNEGPNASAAAAGAGTTDRSRTAAAEDASTERLLAAFQARFGNPSPVHNKTQSQRRNVPADLGKEVPQDLAAARKEAGLCIKCGIKKYEPGGKGHNSRTCKLPADKTTSAVEGRKKANF
jgi:hypothetical protein